MAEDEATDMEGCVTENRGNHDGDTGTTRMESGTGSAPSICIIFIFGKLRFYFNKILLFVCILILETANTSYTAKLCI